MAIKRKCVNKGVCSFPLFQHSFFLHLFLSHQTGSSWSVETPKGAQMRGLNKALDAHSKALLLILQVSAQPLWPVTCPEPRCFSRLWVDLAREIMHEFGHRHMCLRLNFIDGNACQCPNRAVRQKGRTAVGRWRWRSACWLWACLLLKANLIYVVKMRPEWLRSCVYTVRSFL